MLVHCINRLVIGSSIYLDAVLLCQKQKNVGGGGVTFHNSGHRLALGHVNDMRCLGKVHAPANYRSRPEFENDRSYIYQDVNHSFIM